MSGGYLNDADAVPPSPGDLADLVERFSRDDTSDTFDAVTYCDLQRVTFHQAGMPNGSRLFEQARDELIAERDGYAVTTFDGADPAGPWWVSGRLDDPKPESRENYRDASARMADAVLAGGHAYERGVELMGGRVERFVEKFGTEDERAAVAARDAEATRCDVLGAVLAEDQRAQ